MRKALMVRPLVAVLVAGLLTACGSTVSQSARQAAQGGGGELAGGGTNGGSNDDAVVGASTGSDAATAAAQAARGGSATASKPGGVAGASTGGSQQKGPMEIGIVRTGVSNAEAFGVSIGNTVSETDIYNALIAAMNDQGGIAGRRVVPVYGDTDTGSASWSADFEAVCAKFTQDHHVVAVLGFVFGHFDNFEACLTKKGVPHLSTTGNTPDSEVLAQYPLLVNLATPRIERRSREKIDGALATGIIKRGTRLGAVIDGCPGTGRAWTKVTKPYLESKGVVIASTYEIGCADGAGDVGREAGRAPGLVLQFRTAEVDTVGVFGVSESPPVLVIANAAEAQGWHPKYIVSSLVGAAILAGQIPAGQAANVHGYGWMPVLDVNPDRWPSTPPAAQRCIDLAKSKGLKLSAPADFAYAFNLCESMFVYESALKATSSRTDGPAVVRAIEALGSNQPGVLTLEGRLTFGPNRRDAPSYARYFAWDGGCSCFTYRSYAFSFD